MASLRSSYVIGRVHRQLRARLETALTDLDLTVPELTALSVLERGPALSNAHLARRILVSPQAMHKVMTSLEQKGLLDRTAVGGRTLEAALTDQGALLLDQADAVVSEVEREVLGALDEGERQQLLELLVKAAGIASNGQ